MLFFAILLSVVLTSLTDSGFEFKLESETTKIDPAHSLHITVTLKTSAKTTIEMPDLQSRFQGFSLAEDLENEPTIEDDGSRTRIVEWMLIPEPYAKYYRIAPFALGGKVVGPVYFEKPDVREAVTGEMECDLEKDLTLSGWEWVGYVVFGIVIMVSLAFGIWRIIKLIISKVQEHRMSPVERAWVELDRLLKKNLPGCGKYKDFYVELTLVVRRYIQRQHGISAPHLTTEEFFEIARNMTSFNQTGLLALVEFLRKADLIKFAGVKATLATADDATNSAKDYIREDSGNK